MKLLPRFVWLVPAVFLFAAPGRASIILPITTAEHLQTSTGVFRGQVASTQAHVNPADGHIYTRTVVRVDEVFKGKLPPMVKLVHRGGMVGDKGEWNDFAPHFKPGEERVFFVSRGKDGSLYATHGESSALMLSSGGAAPTVAMYSFGQATLNELQAATANGPAAGGDLTDQAASPDAGGGIRPFDMGPSSTASNLITGPGTVGPRFIQQDRGELIPYLIDATYMPTNIPLATGVAAVQAAIAAWSAATSLRFQYGGLQDFGMAASDVPGGDGVLRIQLHDHWNATGGGTGDGIAVGGQGYNTSVVASSWTEGGNVIGNDFYETTSPSVIVQTTNEVFFDPSNLAACCAHEIGHAIGLGHSSDDPNETNQILRQAIMYFALQEDGRGAKLNSFDTNASRQIYPPSNTPPYTYNRWMDIVTTPNPINIPGVNMVEVPGFDLQPASSNLVFETGGTTSGNGTFSVSNDIISYVPNGEFGDTGRIDPATDDSFYDVTYARFSDGTNASPWVFIKVISYSADDYSEGIPNSWRMTYFGSPDPSAGPKRHANDDFDGDGFTNLQEWLLGSDPTDPTSNLRITSFSPPNMQWQAKSYELYELFGSTDLKNWSLALNPIISTNSPGTATNFTSGGPQQFFRVMKVQ